MVGQDDELAVAERLGDARALALGQDDAAKVGQDGLAAEERARVLRRVLERQAERRPRLAVRRVRVADGLNVGTSCR